MKALKKQFKIDLNDKSPIKYFYKHYMIGGEMRNATYYGNYGTALRLFDEDLFNKMFAKRLTALLQVDDMDVICENIVL